MANLRSDIIYDSSIWAPTNILIIGASGFLGSYLYNRFKNNYKVTGTFFSKSDDKLVSLDLTNQQQISNLLDNADYDLIIICGGMTKPDECELNKELTYAVNVESIAYITRHTDAKIIYFSTDYVFDGTKSEYDEYDKPNPINYYGESKLLAESILLKKKNNIVIRVSGIYGLNDHNNEFLNSLNSPEICKPNNLFGSTIFMPDIYNNLPFFFNADPGIYHLSSGSKLSRFDFFKLAIECLNIPSKLTSVELDSMEFKACRPKNTTLISKKLFFNLSNEIEGLQIMNNQLEKGR